MPCRYPLAAGLLLTAFGARAQQPVTNLQVSNITATSATITFSEGQPPAIGVCGTHISYTYSTGEGAGVYYTMPLELTGLLPGRTVTVHVINQYHSQYLGSCVGSAATTAHITFTTLAPLAAAPAVAAGSLALAPNPACTSATLTLAAPLLAPATVQVLDALGREVRRLLLPARAITALLDLAGLAPGLYLVRVGGGLARLVVE